jgi:hypothetical protein
VKESRISLLKDESGRAAGDELSRRTYKDDELQRVHLLLDSLARTLRALGGSLEKQRKTTEGKTWRGRQHMPVLLTPSTIRGMPYVQQNQLKLIARRKEGGARRRKGDDPVNLPAQA